MSGEPFGAPGDPPVWASAAKDAVTTALGHSRVWATIAQGVPSEVYWPATGRPQIRDLDFIVAGKRGWVDLRKAGRYSVQRDAHWAPLARIVHFGDDHELTLELVPDPLRDVVLARFELAGDGLRLYPLLAPRLGASGWDTDAWVTADALLASKPAHAVCLCAEPRFRRASTAMPDAPTVGRTSPPTVRCCGSSTAPTTVT